jgi:hypothetical protein
MGLLCIPAFGAEPAGPGTVNYVEGTVTLAGREITNSDVGSVQMRAGDRLVTQAGKAEVLLDPGIFLRVDDHSAVTMVSPDLAMTEVGLDRGRTAVEVDRIFKQNDVQIMDGGVATQLIKPGYYEFDAAHPEALVFKGRAEVSLGDRRWETLKNHHEVALVEGVSEKPRDFNSSGAGDELYNWSSLRSQYLADANNQIAGDYAYSPGFNPGWYWDPWAYDYTFLGMNPFWSPFGWGFYPWGGWGGGWGLAYNHPFYGHGFHGHYGNPAPARGFHGGGAIAHGGGFHSGGFGGGFHGGGMRGGR